MSNEVISALEDLERQKGIPKEYMLEKVEAALLSAVKKEVGGNNVRVAIDREKGAFHVYRQMTVVEEVTDPVFRIHHGGSKEAYKTASECGRSAGD